MEQNNSDGDPATETARRLSFESSDPCCGASLRKASLVIAVADMVGAIFGIVAAFTAAVVLIAYSEEIMILSLDHSGVPKIPELYKLVNQTDGIKVGVMGFMCLLFIMEAGLATYLYRGAKHRRLEKCEMWWTIKCALFVIGSLTSILFIGTTRHDKLTMGILLVTFMAYRFYVLWVVKAFMRKLKYGQESFKLNRTVVSQNDVVNIEEKINILGTIGDSV